MITNMFRAKLDWQLIRLNYITDYTNGLNELYYCSVSLNGSTEIVNIAK